MNQSFYYLYEASHAMMSPARAWNDAMLSFLGNPANPWSQTPMARTASASAQLFERVTRRYGKPRFDLQSTVVDEALVPVTERIVWSKPFCNLIQFERSLPKGRKRDPKLLIVAPMSGHYATLLRGTVETFLPSHDVYITDWVDARVVPRSQGLFDLDSYIDYVIDILHTLGSDVHVMAVCQPAVPVIAATALMDARNDPSTPASMILIGGPIDTRKSPTAVNKLAETRGTDWFERNCIVKVPFPQAGFGRSVYPGFLQLGGFMAMNFDRHLTAHWDMYKHLVRGDGESAEKQAEFYDEYLAVMDLTAEFYLQTVDTVFVRHELPRGTMTHRGDPVDLTAIRRTAIMAIEGEKDDISGIGQTQAALDLCTSVPASRKRYHLQKDVGHYGVFNGSRFRAEIAPAIRAFTAAYPSHAVQSTDATVTPIRKAGKAG